MKRSVLMMVVLMITILMIAVPATAAAQDGSRLAQFTITHREERASSIEIRLIPHLGRREIYFDMQKGHAQRGEGTWIRRRLQAVEPGVYRLEYRFLEGGRWGLYVHYGSGLAGFDAYVPADIGLEPGGTQTFSAPFRSFPHGAASLPAYVQPVGYAGFGLLVALLVLVVAQILRRLRGQLRAKGYSYQAKAP